MSENQLAKATIEIERHVARGGWDGPLRLFALVYAQEALQQHPELAAELPADVASAEISDPQTLFSVEQEDLPQIDTVGELITQIVWPEEVSGAAVSVERIVLPPSVEVELPEDESEALEFLRNHPERRDVRIVAAALRTGETWCVIRMKDYDDDAQVLSGADLVPGLLEGLQLTFQATAES
ncbi:MAG: PPA1309 family protein [Trueperella sp.]|nr:PPA1309 family protein [Trueperella sp.]